MKKAILILLASVSCCYSMTFKDANTIADAIFHIEGGYKTKYLYGIKSIKVKDEAEARKVCLNTIINQEKRWIASGKKTDYFSSLAARYCPVNDPADKNKLNKNWLSNLRAKLPKDFVIK